MQESLGGCCKTCIIATVSPSILCAEQSIQTLKFAQQAHGIQNKPVMTSRMGTARMESGAPGADGRVSMGDADMMESFNQLQLKCAYMEAEVLEASTALAAKHEKMREAVERAEIAEGNIEAMQKKVDTAEKRADKIERKHAEQLAELQGQVAAQSALLKESAGALAKTQEALASHAALETRELDSLKALASKNNTLVEGQVALIASHRSQLSETLAAHSAGQLQEEHLAALSAMESELQDGAAELSTQLTKQCDKLRESKAALLTGMQAESLVGALAAGQEALQDAMRSQESSLAGLHTELSAAVAKLQTGSKAESALATLDEATGCVQSGVQESTEILAAQQALTAEQSTAMATMESSQRNMEEQMLSTVMEGVRALLQENLAQMASGFDGSLSTVKSTSAAIDQERSKVAERLTALGSDFTVHKTKVEGEVQEWDASNKDVIEACNSVSQMSDTITVSVDEAGNAAMERTTAITEQAGTWAESTKAVAAAVEISIAGVGAAAEGAAAMKTAVGESIASARVESKTWAAHGKAVTEKLHAAEIAASECSTQLTASGEDIAVEFDAAETQLVEQQEVSEGARGAGKDATERAGAVEQHLITMQTQVAAQLVEANETVVKNGGQAAVVPVPEAEAVADAGAAADEVEQSDEAPSDIAAGENPFVPAKTKTAAKGATKAKAKTMKAEKRPLKLMNNVR